MSFVELTGQAKLDRRTKDLIKRLSADDIAIIDHTDLDRVSAEELVESGVRDERELEGMLAEQRGPVTEALEAFAENTMRYLREGGKLLAEGIEFPTLATRFRDRHALVVARGPGYKRDLRMVKPYIRDFKP